MPPITDWFNIGMPGQAVTGTPHGFAANVLAGDPGTTGWGVAPDVLSTFAGSPAALWQAARISQMGEQAAIPQFARTAMQGFTPALGGYMLGGGTGTFGGYLQGTAPNQAALNTGWQNALMASRMLDPSYAADTGQAMTQGMLAQQGFLTGENARRNALAMAQARMGGGVGYGAQARQGALGNLYDLYAARAAGVGRPAGGFLGYLGDVGIT
jgi:hypothetical protein